jgi:hypothetical protein
LRAVWQLCQEPLLALDKYDVSQSLAMISDSKKLLGFAYEADA